MSSEALSFFPDSLADAKNTDESTSVLPFHSPISSQNESNDSVAPIDSSVQQSSDEELLLQIRNGNKDALSLLFQRHGRAVFHVAQRILKDNSEAEDLLQELFLFVFQKARFFDPAKGSAVSWIIQMTYHRAIDRRRYLGSRQHYGMQELKEDLHPASRQVSINEVVAGRELLSKFRERLTEEQRQTLELHFFEGYSFQEIADKTGQTYGNVRNHYYRGLGRLRSFIFPEKDA
ncbi:sigma-70 family RNA polymerase sigma factor [Edaphobacter sp. HDX4]|uniref:RNA polymerase sigma factor n=1 Tax=Edaphobacter sp. HDX4 TaxID=2794064 RepID=UPI002FE56FB7